jgi:hypothetical protein
VRVLAGSLMRAAAGRRVRWLVLALAAVALVEAAAAPTAQAIPLPGPLGPITTALGFGGGQVAVGAFEAIVSHLFAPVAKFVNVALIGWLIAVPDLTQGNVRELQATVCAMGAAALGAVATISVARFWLAGLAGGAGSGFEALEGLGRTVGAALFLVLWPWLFDTGVGLTNLFTRSLMGAASVTDDSARLLAVGLGAAAGLGGTSVGAFLMIVIAVAASLLFLGLLVVKLVLGVSTVLVFVAMPAAVVLWPIPACAWLARLCARAFAVCLLVPVCWALCFAATAAVGVDALGLRGAGGVDALIEPLVAIVLLYVTVTLPRSLARVAMLGGGLTGHGVASRAVGYAAGRTLAGAVTQHVPVSAGGRRGANPPGVDETPRAPRDEPAGGGRSAGALAAAPQRVSARAPEGSPTARTTAAESAPPVPATRTEETGQVERAAYTPPADAAATSATTSADGLQSPSFHGREHQHALEMMAAESRAASRPVSDQQAAKALRALPSDTRRGVAGLVREHGAGAREHLAYQALGDWSGEEREALRTLAAATPDVRERALGTVLSDAPGVPGTNAAASQLSGAGGSAAPAPDAGPDPSGPAPRPVGGDSPEESS